MSVLRECTLHIRFCFLLPSAMNSCWPWAHARVCTCPCMYLTLREGNVQVTVRNYGWGGQGGNFLACSIGKGVLPQAKRARHCCFASWCLSKAALETKLPGSGGHSTASEWNVPSWFKVQPPEPEGPADHLRPPTHAPSIYSPPRSTFISPTWITDGRLLCRGLLALPIQSLKWMRLNHSHYMIDDDWINSSIIEKSNQV